MVLNVAIKTALIRVCIMVIVRYILCTYITYFVFSVPQQFRFRQLKFDNIGFLKAQTGKSIFNF